MKMIKLFAVLIFGGLLWVSCSKDDVVSSEAQTDVKDVLFSKGNDALGGAHYNLNIIGMPKGKSADMTVDQGHRIFVNLWGTSKIMLTEGDDFMVLDANGTDGTASFQLPNPDLDGNGMTSYSIWLRALGKPGGNAVITTCADADVDDITLDGYVEVCSAESVDITRSKGPSKFTNVTKTLLTILINEDIYENDVLIIEAGRYTIFDEALEGYFWEYDNNGLKLLQMRFYPIGTSIL